MKKKYSRILLILLGIVAIPLLRFNSTHYIKNQEWKYADGTYIGDWLNHNNIEINDKIIKGNNGEAKIVFCFGYKLIIKNIENGETGYYVNRK
jgi:hypothetical protein